MPVFHFVDPISGREVGVSRDEIAAMLSHRFSFPIDPADVLPLREAV